MFFFFFFFYNRTIEWAKEEISSRKLEIPKESHSNTGIIKGIKGMDLVEADDIKKRWQEYTEDLYKNVLNDPDNHGVLITQLEQTSWNTKSNGH